MTIYQIYHFRSHQGRSLLRSYDFSGLKGYASSMERMISAVKTKNTYFVKIGVTRHA